MPIPQLLSLLCDLFQVEFKKTPTQKHPLSLDHYMVEIGDLLFKQQHLSAKKAFQKFDEWVTGTIPQTDTCPGTTVEGCPTVSSCRCSRMDLG